MRGVVQRMRFKPDQRRQSRLLVGLGAFLLLALIGGIIWDRADSMNQVYRNRSTVKMPIEQSVRLRLPPPDLYRPIAPEEALKLNAERAFSDRLDTPAAPFKLPADKGSSERALECLTQAVYYEAASEGVNGQRAVAQVILNRMRHPAYPASVCGVIYQGSDRTTGCQFTFTCDGSLARAPLQSLWKQARRIASEALAGKVFAPVGHATHYHANYVSPYWADSLDKSVQIARHIFYRLKGSLGAKGAFRQRYAGAEPLPPAPSTVEVSLEAIESVYAPNAPAPDTGLQVEAGELVKATELAPSVVADAERGSLLLDGEAAAARPAGSGSKPKLEGCTKESALGRLRPMTADDRRAQSQSGC